MSNEVNIRENDILQQDPALMELLLIDRSRPFCGNNPGHIIWATDSYESLGPAYSENSPITVDLITGENGSVIVPRVRKSKAEQQYRSREKGEVFTPAWICNHQNNLVDNTWFGCPNLFNREEGKSWKTNPNPIPFPTKDGKDWQDYVKDTRMEITCGEAPYLISRYDTITGEIIPVKDRVGLLGRKLRVVAENASTPDEWYEWVKQAYMATYAYEWQGDNLLLARENALFSFFDYFQDKFPGEPTKEQAREIATIISWNFWQMDGIKGVIPNSCSMVDAEVGLFGDPVPAYCRGCANPDEKDSIRKHIGIYCRIMDWEKHVAIRFVELIK